MTIQEIDERLLVEAHQAGDLGAFDTIVRTQWRGLFAHAMRRLRDPEAAEDAVQDTLLRAYRALPKLTGDLALRAWLHRILTNVCYDEGNRRRREAGLIERVSAQPVIDAPDPVEEAVLHDTVRVMADALRELPESYREALVLRYVDGLSFREVADTVGITEENARARVHRGRQALAKVMSRLAVLAAFIVPGLRRAEQATPVPGSEQAVDHVSLVTQLTSHALNAAPAVTRVAAEVSALPSGKSAILTGALAAALAVTVPVAAYKVREAATPDRPRPAAVAAPLDDTDAPPATPGTVATESAPGKGDAVGAPEGRADVAAPAIGDDAGVSPEAELPNSAIRPFEPVDGSDGGTDSEGTTTTTEATTTTVPKPPPVNSVTVGLGGDDLAATGAGPNVDISGPVTLSDGERSQVSGRLSIYADGSVTGELTLVVDGTAYPLRIRGTVVEQGSNPDEKRFTGVFSLAGGDAFGFPESGDLTAGSFERTGDAASLSLTLEGEDPSS